MFNSDIKHSGDKVGSTNNVFIHDLEGLCVDSIPPPRPNCAF